VKDLTNFGVLTLHPFIMFSSLLRLVRVRDHELVTLGYRVTT
jgi:hypothetical protein